MKNKKISKKIKKSFDLIREFNRMEKSLINKKAGNLFKEHLKHHDQILGLKMEISSLENALKSRKKEIKIAIKELLKSRKITRKALKKSTKTAPHDNAPGNIKASPDKVVPVIKRKVDSHLKPNKTKVKKA